MIVVADDLGRSEAHNEAILRALDEGLVDAASLIANMPSAVGASGHLVGVHLNLTVGAPLTEPISRFCDGEGRFVEWRRESGLFRLAEGERGAVECEWRAQIERARELGVTIAHLDSHHHVHTEWPLGAIAIRLAREYGVPRVRIARNCGPGLGLANLAYKRLYNARLRHAGLAGTKYFGNPRDWLHLKAGGAGDDELGDFEVMVHPVLRGDGQLVDDETPETPLASLLEPLRAALVL